MVNGLPKIELEYLLLMYGSSTGHRLDKWRGGGGGGGGVSCS